MSEFSAGDAFSSVREIVRKIVHLYDVPRNTRIAVKLDDGSLWKLNFHHVDGMYSYCTDDEGNVVHLAAWTDVEIEK